jgi:hypothetical protein
MSKARDLANAGTALTTVSATELGYLDGVTSAVQTQINSKIGQSTAINPSTVTTKGDILVATGSGTVVRQGVGTNGQFLQADSAEADGVKWSTVSQYTLPSQTGNAGKFLTTNGTSESWANVGITWTQRTNGLAVGGFNMIAYNGTNLYVAVGTAGQLFTSPDAITWTSRTSQFGSNNINAVAFANNLWVIGGQSGNLATSTDGITWTLRTSQFGTNAIFNVKYVNSLWFALGAGGPRESSNTGGLSYSSDGSTWTKANLTNAAFDSPTDIEFANGHYVVVTTAYGANNGGYTTNLNSGWVGINMENLGASRCRIIWNGSTWIYTSNAGSGNTMYSTSTPPASGTWSNVSPQLSSSGSVLSVRTSGNTIYSLKDIGTTQTALLVLPWTITSGVWNSIGSTIYAPSAGLTSYNVLCLNATGGYIVSDGNGRIYTSF